MKIINTDSFIKKANEIHNNKYDYTNTIWINSRSKLTIECPIHGLFEQKANNHISGYGCLKCGNLNTKKKQALSKEEFIQKSKKIHNNKYDYSEVNYINTTTKIALLCKKHGRFLITPSNHLHKTNPQGCPSCGIESRSFSRKLHKKELLDAFNKTHNNKYDYTYVDYKDYHTKVNIKCHIHGIFSQTPAHHISGTGCPKCASYGFNKNKPALLYYLSINNGQAYKVGITNRTVELRYNIIDLKKIEVIWTKEFYTGEEAYDIEQSILKKYKEHYYTGIPLLESGNTELFNTNILPTTDLL